MRSDYSKSLKSNDFYDTVEFLNLYTNEFEKRGKRDRKKENRLYC